MQHLRRALLMLVAGVLLLGLTTIAQPIRTANAGGRNIYSITYTALATTYSGIFYPKPGCTVVVCTVLATQAGTFTPQVRLSNGTWYDVGTGAAATANTVDHHVFAFPLPNVRLKYTNTSSASGTGIVECQEGGENAR